MKAAVYHGRRDVRIESVPEPGPPEPPYPRVVGIASNRDVRTQTAPLSDLKRAMLWLRAQYQRRAEEAARGQDRVIERIRKSRNKPK